MVLQKIGKLCKKNGTIVIVNRPDGTQWLGTPAAMYPVYGISLTPDSVFALFDIGNEREGYKIIEIYEDELMSIGYSIDDADEDETALMTLGFSICCSGGRELEPLAADNMIILIDPDNLSPLKGYPSPQMFARKGPYGTPYIAVKSGLQIIALIPSEKIDENVAKCLGEVSKRADTVSGFEAFRSGKILCVDSNGEILPPEEGDDNE